jgi:hypothetical protein
MNGHEREVKMALTLWTPPAAILVSTRAFPTDVAPLLSPRFAVDTATAARPRLPATLRALTPLTATLVVARETATSGSMTARRVASRTADRLHLQLADRREWLFESNAADPGRVAALMTDHAARLVVVYEETELQNWEGIRGWADVAALGVDLAALPNLGATRVSRMRGGLRFDQLTALDARTWVREVWWNADQFLPMSLSVTSPWGTVHQVIESLRLEIDAGVLDSPIRRFPAYKVVDFTDWLER